MQLAGDAGQQTLQLHNFCRPQFVHSVESNSSVNAQTRITESQPDEEMMKSRSSSPQVVKSYRVEGSPAGATGMCRMKQQCSDATALVTDLLYFAELSETWQSADTFSNNSTTERPQIKFANRRATGYNDEWLPTVQRFNERKSILTSARTIYSHLECHTKTER